MRALTAALRRAVPAALAAAAWVTGCDRDPSAGQPQHTPVGSHDANAPDADTRPRPRQITPSPVKNAPGRAPDPRAGKGTRGLIACGSGTCPAATEGCVQSSGGWRCIPAAELGQGAFDPQLGCDDGSDCPEGQTCCASVDVLRGRTQCMTPDLADGSPCTLQACVPGEGAPCPPNHACRDNFCRPDPPPRASCGPSAATRCPASAPWCRYENGKGACATAGLVLQEPPGTRLTGPLPDAGVQVAPGTAGAYQCTRNADCGPAARCCAVHDDGADEVTQTECRRACGTTFYEDVCERDADCPPGLVTGASGGLERRVCRPRAKSPKTPPWLGVCGFASDRR